ncbi:MAG: hypothetical protein AB4352_06755 [Hormoscilla sp.]
MIDKKKIKYEPQEVRYPTALEKLSDMIKPGDAIAFSGKGFNGKVIRCFTASLYSHIAIVMDTERDCTTDGRIAIAEASSDTRLPDFRNEKRKPGVQIHHLWNWINAYQDLGQAWWIPLAEPLSDSGVKKMQDWLWEIHDRQVSYSFRKCIGAWLKINRYFLSADSQYAARLFCSELVTKALQIAEAIDPAVRSYQQIPQEIISLPCFQDPIKIEI